MKKDCIAEAIATKRNITKKEAMNQINDVLDVIESGLLEGEKVSIVNFGSFEVKTRKARVGRNPQTGAEMQIDEQKFVAFKVGKGLREKVKVN